MDLIRIRYTDSDPVHAAAIVNTISTAYQRHRANTAREAATRSRDFIRVQMEVLNDSLRKVQEQLVAYQEQSQIVAPEVEVGARMDALFQAERERDELRFTQTVLQGRLDQLASASEGQEGEILSSIMNLGDAYVQGASSYNSQYQQLISERRALTGGRFGMTAESERVQMLDSRIESVVASMRDAATIAGQLLNRRLSDAQSRIASLRTEVARVPSQTAELTRLQQLVDAVRQPYETMANEYYQAQIAQGVEAGDVEVVDPAPVPLRPDPSQKALNMAIALMAGLLLGAMGAVVLERLDLLHQGLYRRRACQRVRGAGERPAHFQRLRPLPDRLAGSGVVPEHPDEPAVRLHGRAPGACGFLSGSRRGEEHGGWPTSRPAMWIRAHGSSSSTRTCGGLRSTASSMFRRSLV